MFKSLAATDFNTSVLVEFALQVFKNVSELSLTLRLGVSA